jgi:catechol 2,3-dioxygenase-like lactoylglutathione lyase family enzyme
MEKAVPILPADDLSAAKQFYVDKLGFRVTFEEGDGKSGIMGVERGTISITIDAPMSGHGRHACVSLYVTDADRYYREWREKIGG